MIWWELYSSNLFEVNWMINKKLWERSQKEHGTNWGTRNNMEPIGEQGAYDLNLLLPEVEVWTNIWSDAPSHVTDWALSHNVRKTQVTRNEKSWRLIWIQSMNSYKHYFYSTKQMRQVGISTRDQYRAWNRWFCHPPPHCLRQWPFYLYTGQ